jgi:hypothetical protein
MKGGMVLASVPPTMTGERVVSSSGLELCRNMPTLLDQTAPTTTKRHIQKKRTVALERNTLLADLVGAR